MGEAIIKVNPMRLPKPLLPPTRSVRIPEKPGNLYEYDYKLDEKRRKAALGPDAPPRRRGKGPLWTWEQEDKMIRLMDEGVSLEEAAKAIGRTVEATKLRIRKVKKDGRMLRD